MPDGFDLFGGMPLAQEPMAEPLPVRGRPAPTPPQDQKASLKQLGPLLALIPLAMKKGGPQGVAALLQGYQQRQAEKRQQGQQGYQNERQAWNDQTAADDRDLSRQTTIDNQRLSRETQAQTQLRALAQQYQTALSTAQTPEEVQAVTQAYTSLGLPVEIAQQFGATVTPTKLEQRAAQKVMGELEKLKPEELAYYDRGGIKYKGKTVQEWRAAANVAFTDETGAQVVAPPVVKPNAVNPGSFEDYTVRYAKDHGKTVETLTSADLEDARKRYMQADDRPRITVNTGGGGALPPQAATIVRSFDALPIVKTTQKMAEAVTFADSLDPNTKNPADDQALIYAFAKAMDPDSVVREGEYATVQKYAQSWAQSIGFDAARLFSNTQFLTAQARQNMKRTIRTRYLAGRQQYDNVRRSYVSRINKATGRTDGDEHLTDYAGGFPADATGAPATGRATVTPAPSHTPAEPTIPGSNPFRRQQ